MEAYTKEHQELERLNEQFSEIVEDLDAVKESKEKLSKELKKKLKDAEELNTAQSAEIEEQTRALQGLQTKLNEVDAQRVQAVEAYTKEHQELERLNQKTISLKKTIAVKERESKELNKTIDTIVNDLASIKESKCWIYTKPLRDLQQLFEGNKNEN